MEFIVDNMQSILGILISLLSTVIGILLLIPGNQDETFLIRIKNFLTQFVKK